MRSPARRRSRCVGGASAVRRRAGLAQVRVHLGVARVVMRSRHRIGGLLRLDVAAAARGACVAWRVAPDRRDATARRVRRA
ncbi:hypothetical protein WS73_11640 [Burkholderia savannae]|nr:hypothetical protein WS73_11640 [Burkholderia savannae]